MLRVAQIVIDSADAAKLAGFWSQVLGRPVDPGANPYFATISAEPKLMFLQVPEAKQAKNRLHIDLHGENWQDEVERVVARGAARLCEHKEYGTQWVARTDPEGNEFDLGAG